MNIAQTEQRLAILGVVDGFCDNDLESDEVILSGKDLLRQIGYKL
nr:adenosine-specific kinase [Pseudomonas sp. Irchel 3A7]